MPKNTTRFRLPPWLTRHVVALALSTACFCSTALAQSGSGNLYVVSNVRVDETAATSVQARNNAISDGQQRAFDVLVGRLVASQDRGRVPDLGAVAIQRLLRNMDVQGEKLTAVRYLANLTMHFSPAAVRNFLNRSSVPFVDRVSPQQLLVPMIIAGTGLRVAPPGHAWRGAWETVAREGFVPLRIPAYAALNERGRSTRGQRAGLTDSARQNDDAPPSGAAAQPSRNRGALAGAFDPDIFLEQDQIALNALAKRFRASGAIGAVLLPDDGKQASLAYIVGTSSAGPTDFRVAVRRGDLGEDGAADDNTASTETLAASLDEAADILASSAKERLNVEWRRASSTSTASAGNRYFVGLRFDTFGEWDGYRRAIVQFPSLQGFDVTALSTRSAMVSFLYSGGNSRLRSLFARQSLALTPEPSLGEGVWLASRSRTRARSATTPSTPTRSSDTGPRTNPETRGIPTTSGRTDANGNRSSGSR